MEKYSRILVIIFFLLLINIGFSIYITSNINLAKVSPLQTESLSPKSTNQPVLTNTSNNQTDLSLIKNDLTILKAELRAMRESLNGTGLITVTPEP